jgi:hypothetical protein
VRVGTFSGAAAAWTYVKGRRGAAARGLAGAAAACAAPRARLGASACNRTRPPPVLTNHPALPWFLYRPAPVFPVRNNQQVRASSGPGRAVRPERAWPTPHHHSPLAVRWPRQDAWSAGGRKISGLVSDLAAASAPSVCCPARSMGGRDRRHHGSFLVGSLPPQASPPPRAPNAMELLLPNNSVP